MSDQPKVSTTQEKIEPAKDGTKIYYKAWKVSAPKAVVGIVHGLGEHCNRYQHVAAFFNKLGIAVVSYDRRGHGESEGKRGHTPDFEFFFDEINVLFQWASELFPHTPQIIYGHSMGANLVLNYCLDKTPDFIGVIATGPWIRIPNPPSKALMTFARLMDNLFPAYSQGNGLNPRLVSTDPVEAEKYINDPLVHDRISARLAVRMFDAADRLDNYSEKFPYPLLIMHGEADQFTDPKGTIAFVERIKGEITFKLWPTMYHEIHNEVDRHLVF